MLTARKMFSVSFAASATAALATGTTSFTTCGKKALRQRARLLVVGAHELGHRSGRKGLVTGILAFRRERKKGIIANHHPGLF